MTPAARDLPIASLPPGAPPPRAPRGYVAVRIHGTSHMARRGYALTLCRRDVADRERSRPLAVCLTCAALIAELAR
jgi:hypothetical protein